RGKEAMIWWEWCRARPPDCLRRSIKWRGPPRVSGPLSRQIEERQVDDGGRDPSAASLDRPFDEQGRAGRGQRCGNGSETDHLLDRRPPGDALRPADLCATMKERDRIAMDHR